MSEGNASAGLGHRVASWGDRVGAFLVDVVVLLPLWVVVLFVADASPSLANITGWALVALWIYGRLLDALRGQTPGKALLGYRVVDSSTGGPLGPGRGLLRWVFGLLFMIVLGPINYLIVPLVSRRHQTMHDMIGSAVVIQDPASRRPFGLGLWMLGTQTPPHEHGVSPAVSGSSVASGAVAQAEVAAGAARPPRTVKSSRRLAIWTAVAVAAILSLDWYQRNGEMDRLLTSVQRSEAAMEDSIARTEESLTQLKAAADSRDGCTPSYYSPSSYQGCLDNANAAIQAAVTRISSSARTYSEAVADAGDEIEGLAILPWHSAIRAARDDYLEHNEVWERYLRAVSVDANQLGTFGEEISRTFEAAEVAFRDAIPMWPRFNAQERVDDIFAE